MQKFTGLIQSYYPEKKDEPLSVYEHHQYPIMGKILEAHFDNPNIIGNRFRPVQLPEKEREYVEHFQRIGNDDSIKGYFVDRQNVGLVINLSKSTFAKELAFLNSYFIEGIKIGTDTIVETIVDFFTTLLAAIPSFMSTFKTLIAEGLAIAGFLVKKLVTSVLDWMADMVRRLLSMCSLVEKHKIASVLEIATIPLDMMKNGYIKAAGFEEDRMLFNSHDPIIIPTDHELAQQMVGMANIILVYEDIRRFYQAFPQRTELTRTMAESFRAYFFPKWALFLEILSDFDGHRLTPVSPDHVRMMLSMIRDREAAQTLEALYLDEPYTLCVRVLNMLLEEDPLSYFEAFLSKLVTISLRIVRAHARAQQQISTRQMQQSSTVILGLVDLSDDQVEFLHLHDGIKVQTPTTDLLVSEALRRELRSLDALPSQHSVADMVDVITRSQKKGRFRVLKHLSLYDDYVKYIQHAWRYVHIPNTYRIPFTEDEEQEEDEALISMNRSARPFSSSSSTYDDNDEKETRVSVSAIHEDALFKLTQFTQTISNRVSLKTIQTAFTNFSNQLTDLSIIDTLDDFNPNPFSEYLNAAAFAQNSFSNITKPALLRYFEGLDRITASFTKLLSTQDTMKSLVTLQNFSHYLSIYKEILNCFDKIFKVTMKKMDEMKDFSNNTTFRVKEQYREIVTRRLLEDCRDSPSLWEAITAGTTNVSFFKIDDQERLDLLASTDVVRHITHLMSLYYLHFVANLFHEEFILRAATFVTDMLQSPEGIFFRLHNLIKDLHFSLDADYVFDKNDMLTAFIAEKKRDQEAFNTILKQIHADKQQALAASTKYSIAHTMSVFQRTSQEFSEAADDTKKVVDGLMTLYHQLAINTEMNKYDEEFLSVRKLSLGAMFAMGVGFAVLYANSVSSFEWNTFDSTNFVRIGGREELIQRCGENFTSIPLRNCTELTLSKESLSYLVNRESHGIFNDASSALTNGFFGSLWNAYSSFKSSANPHERAVAEIIEKYATARSLGSPDPGWFDWIKHTPLAIKGAMAEEGMEFTGDLLADIKAAKIDWSQVSMSKLNESSWWKALKGLVWSSNEPNFFLESLKNMENLFQRYKVWKTNLLDLKKVTQFNDVREWFASDPSATWIPFQNTLSLFWDWLRKHPFQTMQKLAQTFRGVNTDLALGSFQLYWFIGYQVPWIAFVSFIFSAVASVYLQKEALKDRDVDSSISKLWESLKRFSPDIELKNADLLQRVEVPRKSVAILLKLTTDLLFRTSIIVAGLMLLVGAFATYYNFTHILSIIDWYSIFSGVAGIGTLSLIFSALGSFSFNPLRFLDLGISTYTNKFLSLANTLTNSERLNKIKDAVLNKDNLKSFVAEAIETPSKISNFIIGINPDALPALKELTATYLATIREKANAHARSLVYFSPDESSKPFLLTQFYLNLGKVSNYLAAEWAKNPGVRLDDIHNPEDQWMVSTNILFLEGDIIKDLPGVWEAFKSSPLSIVKIAQIVTLPPYNNTVGFTRIVFRQRDISDSDLKILMSKIQSSHALELL